MNSSQSQQQEDIDTDIKDPKRLHSARKVYSHTRRVTSDTGRQVPLLSLLGEAHIATGETSEMTADVKKLFRRYASASSISSSGFVKDIKEKTVKRKLTRAEKTDHELFMELIYDIQHELDVERLCFKILHNIAVLTNCDRSSLFLTRKDRDKKKCLVCKLFDLTSNSQYEDVCQSEENTFIIPFGKGILGYVAESKEFVKIDNAYEVSVAHLFHIFIR